VVLWSAASGHLPLGVCKSGVFYMAVGMLTMYVLIAREWASGFHAMYERQPSPYNQGRWLSPRVKCLGRGVSLRQLASCSQPVSECRSEFGCPSDAIIIFFVVIRSRGT
jgi:hypothetical protein